MAAQDLRPLAPGTRIVVVGTGYVGLPAALLLAHAGHEVVGVDVNPAVVEAINAGRLHVEEEGLQRLLDECDGRLSARTTPVPADVFIIAVPTPLAPRRRTADLRFVDAALDAIVPHVGRGNVVILESTVPPLTCREHIVTRLRARGLVPGESVFVAHCPERILPGNVLHEIVHNDRIIGGVTPACAAAAASVYATFVESQLHLTDDVTAELCKLAENAYRDVNIAFANEMAAVAEEIGVDIRHVIALTNRHPRVAILQPSIGVGGHCIPIDPWFIAEVSPEHARLIATARAINDAMPERIAGKIRRALREVDAPSIVAIGATYKPDVADVRESPALEVVRSLRADGYAVRHVDPLVPELRYDRLVDVARGADALVILVPHRCLIEELERDEHLIRGAMRTPIIVRF